MKILRLRGLPAGCKQCNFDYQQQTNERLNTANRVVCSVEDNHCQSHIQKRKTRLRPSLDRFYRLLFPSPVLCVGVWGPADSGCVWTCVPPCGAARTRAPSTRTSLELKIYVVPYVLISKSPLTPHTMVLKSSTWGDPDVLPPGLAS